ncbi:MAG: hypothetical protein QME07_02900 [bacterium]|nr:hypothetical protein [bacterium]
MFIKRANIFLVKPLQTNKENLSFGTYQKVKEEKGPNDKIYFMDATHPCHNSMPSYGWIPKGKTKELPSNTGRKRININGAIDVLRS